VPAALSVAAAARAGRVMPGHEDTWYRPGDLYRDGFPDDISSAMRISPTLRDRIREEVATVAHDLILEVGPGDLPATDGLGRVVYLDVARTFLARLAGARVQADLFAAPFETGTFDVVVAADVLTHIRPGRRREAIETMARLGRNVVLFNPETGAEKVRGSRVASPLIPETLRALGMTVHTREFRVHADVDYRLMLFTGRR